MTIKSGVLFLIAAIIFISSYATPLDSIGVSKINNKLHVKYLVSPGETIYGISTKYGVPVSDLMELNPELENGLKVGQVINIPYDPTAIKPTKKYDDNVIVHKVQPGETFYSLSKKYNTSIDELMKLNNIQLKAGQEIVVGYKNQTANNTTITPNNTVTNTTTNNNTTTTTNTTTNNTNSNTEVKNNQSTNTNTTTGNNNTTISNNSKNNTTTANNNTTTTTNNTTTKSTTATEQTSSMEMYPFDPSRKQILIIPFDPYLYFSDADDEIAARSDMPRTKVRQVFRKRLNALLDPPGYENIRLLGGKAKDSISDLNKIYSMVTYNYQQVVVSPYYKEPVEQAVTNNTKGNKNWLEKQKDKIAGNDVSTSKYDIQKDLSSYFGVIIKNQDFFTYFNQKYSVDYYIFVSQFEVKTNYEHCLDRAAQNYDRTFTTHFSIFDNTGKQISGNKFKTHYNSNTNYIYTIVADNIEKIAQRIMMELPPPGN